MLSKDDFNICYRRKSKLFLVVDISELSDPKMFNHAVRKCIHDAKYSAIACDVSLSIDILVFNYTAKWICKDEDINTYRWLDMDCMGVSEPSVAFNELYERMKLYNNTLKFYSECFLSSIVLISDYDKSSTCFDKLNKLFSNVWFGKSVRIGIASKNKKTSLLLSFATSEETVLFADNLYILKELISFPEILIEWSPEEKVTIDSMSTISGFKNGDGTKGNQSSVSKNKSVISKETENSKKSDDSSLSKTLETFLKEGETEGKTEDKLDAKFKLIMNDYYDNPEENDIIIKCDSDEKKLVRIMENFYEKGEAEGKTEEELDAEFGLIMQEYYNNPEENDIIIKCDSDEKKLVRKMEDFYEKGEAEGKTEEELDAEFELFMQKYYDDITKE